MTLQRATQYALVGIWIYFLVSIFQWTVIVFGLGFLNNPWAARIVWLAQDIFGAIPLIIFFKVLSKNQSRESGA